MTRYPFIYLTPKYSIKVVYGWATLTIEGTRGNLQLQGFEAYCLADRLSKFNGFPITSDSIIEEYYIVEHLLSKN